MILDHVDNLKKYSPLLGDLGLVITFYEECLLEKKEPGQYQLDGDSLMVNVDLSSAKTAEEAKLEAHKKYIDIQICLYGDETIGWKNLEQCTQPEGSFDEKKDYIFYQDRIENWFRVPVQHFTIFYPDDAHAPLVGEGILFIN